MPPPSINFVQLILIVLAFIMAFTVLRPLLFGGRRISAQDAYLKLKEGNAVLIDVREPGEWRSGVAQPAKLLPLSDLRGERRQWGQFLAANKDKELILYCASGLRSGTAAIRLKKEGFNAVNLGGLRRWTSINLPTRKP